MTTKTNPTRRSFLAGIAAAAAATALPSTGEARTATSWAGLRETFPALRAAYLAEIERFAETLRPRFEAGELYGYRSEDYCDASNAAGMDALEAATRAHFGLEVRKETRGQWTWEIADDEQTPYLILAVSPCTDGTDIGWEHVAHHATAAASWDVLLVARRCGWYPMSLGEDPHPGHIDGAGACPYCAEALS